MTTNDDDLRNDLDHDMRALEEQLLEKAYQREALNEVEARLEKGDLAGATALMRELRLEFPRGDGGPDLFDGFLAQDPFGEGFHYEVRARIYRDARLLRDARADVVRALLVTPSSEVEPLLDQFAALAGTPSAEWMDLAFSAVVARLWKKPAREKDLLLQAIRKAPDELALFAALAVHQLGSCSDVELFALRQLVRVAPSWTAARQELHRAAKAIGDRDAERIEHRPTPSGEASSRPKRGRNAA